jgi:hypothetical protein
MESDMQMDMAAKLRKAWGDKSCAHKELDKEYYLGMSTGDYVCMRCGKEFSEPEWRARLRDSTLA